MCVYSIVNGINLLNKVGVDFVKHFFNEILVCLLLLLPENARDDVSAVVEVHKASRTQFCGPLFTLRHCGGVLGKGLLVMVVPFSKIITVSYGDGALLCLLQAEFRPALLVGHNIS